MLAQRFTKGSLRRLAVQQHTLLGRPTLSKFSAPAAIAISNHRVQSRSLTTQTQPVNQDDGYQILVKQRLNRPVSPHLGIYRPQITWYLSALNRITGSGLSGAFYIFGISYLAAPLFGLHFGSAEMAAAFGSLPMAVKVALKFGVALPFTFHSLNGLRHLAWDTGRQISNRQVQVTGWTVVGATIVSSGILAAL